MRAATVLAVVAAGLVLTARPARAQAIFFVLDVSGSMAATDVDTKGTTRFIAMESAVLTMINNVPPGIQVGFLSFDNIVQIEQTLTLDKAVFLAKLAALRQPGATTSTGDALNAALPQIQPASGKKVIILITDGTPVPLSQGPIAITAATNSGNAGIGICVIGFGSNVGVPGPDAQFLTDIAVASAGTVILAPSSAVLATALDTCLGLFTVNRTKKVFAAVVSFPNPVIGSSASITFAAAPTGVNLTDTSESTIVATASSINSVTVFDLSGRKIIHLSGNSSAATPVVWNTRNSNGTPISSGMYFYVVEFANGTTGRGKFTIIR